MSDRTLNLISSVLIAVTLAILIGVSFWKHG